MNDLITISGVRGYVDENGTAYLNVEDTARGLGFIDGISVRWARVRKYLDEFGFSAKGGDGSVLQIGGAANVYVPENIFYRLAMKAKNEAAKTFQAKVADEIIPAIRKTGSYSLKPMSIEDMIIAQATSVKELKTRIEKLEQSAAKKMDLLEILPPVKDMTSRATLRQIVDGYVKRSGLNHQDAYRELYQQFYYRYGVNLSTRADHRGISKIEAAEQGGHLPELLSVAIQLFA